MAGIPEVYLTGTDIEIAAFQAEQELREVVAEFAGAGQTRGGVPEVYFTGTEAEISVFQQAQEAREVAAEEGRPAWKIAAEVVTRRAAAIAIDIKVTGVEPLAKSFETLSARAHKNLIPNVLARSVNRLNDAIVKNIPVGPRGHEGDTGGWRNAQSRIRPSRMPTRGRHTTTVAALLPEEHKLGIRAGDDYYPFDVEYGSRIVAAFAPIRRAVNALEKSVFGEILDLFGHGLAGLAIPIGVGLLLRKVIFGRATPKEFMPIEWSRARPGDFL